ncbi:hypothetical protein ACMYYO_07305 [Dermacoccaceae bacterium W4C1]
MMLSACESASELPHPSNHQTQALRAIATSEWGVSSNVRVNEQMTYGGLLVCKESWAKDVQVTGVSFTKSDAPVAISRFTVKRRGDTRWENYGGVDQGIDELKLPQTPARITGECGSDEAVYDILFTAQLTKNAVADSTIDIAYKEGSRTGRLTLSFHLKMCPPDSWATCGGAAPE